MSTEAHEQLQRLRARMGFISPEQAKGREPDPLHPRGRCTCSGEGRCYWCRTTCRMCGVEVPDTCCEGGMTDSGGATQYDEPIQLKCLYCGGRGCVPLCSTCAEGLDIDSRVAQAERENSRKRRASQRRQDREDEREIAEALECCDDETDEDETDEVPHG